MKVSLAVSILSSCNADALTYCSMSLKLPEFENCKGTIEFCRNMNYIFDLNTRNFLSKSPYKRPLSQKNIEHCNNFSISYLSSLKDKDHVPITKSIRKTGFNGLIICLKSVKQLSIDLVLSGKMKFILTYKLSQDQLELLFSTV